MKNTKSYNSYERSILFHEPSPRDYVIKSRANTVELKEALQIAGERALRAIANSSQDNLVLNIQLDSNKISKDATINVSIIVAEETREIILVGTQIDPLKNNNHTWISKRPSIGKKELSEDDEVKSSSLCISPSLSSSQSSLRRNSNVTKSSSELFGSDTHGITGSTDNTMPDSLVNSSYNDSIKSPMESNFSEENDALNCNVDCGSNLSDESQKQLFCQQKFAVNYEMKNSFNAFNILKKTKRVKEDIKSISHTTKGSSISSRSSKKGSITTESNITADGLDNIISCPCDITRSETLCKNGYNLIEANAENIPLVPPLFTLRKESLPNKENKILHITVDSNVESIDGRDKATAEEEEERILKEVDLLSQEPASLYSYTVQEPQMSLPGTIGIEDEILMLSKIPLFMGNNGIKEEEQDRNIDNFRVGSQSELKPLNTDSRLGRKDDVKDDILKQALCDISEYKADGTMQDMVCKERINHLIHSYKSVSYTSQVVGLSSANKALNMVNPKISEKFVDSDLSTNSFTSLNINRNKTKANRDRERETGVNNHKKERQKEVTRVSYKVPVKLIAEQNDKPKKATGESVAQIDGNEPSSKKQKQIPLSTQSRLASNIEIRREQQGETAAKENIGDTVIGQVETDICTAAVNSVMKQVFERGQHSKEDAQPNQRVEEGIIRRKKNVHQNLESDERINVPINKVNECRRSNDVTPCESPTQNNCLKSGESLDVIIKGEPTTSIEEHTKSESNSKKQNDWTSYHSELERGNCSNQQLTSMMCCLPSSLQKVTVMKKDLSQPSSQELLGQKSKDQVEMNLPHQEEDDSTFCKAQIMAIVTAITKQHDEVNSVHEVDVVISNKSEEKINVVFSGSQMEAIEFCTSPVAIKPKLILRAYDNVSVCEQDKNILEPYMNPAFKVSDTGSQAESTLGLISSGVTVGSIDDVSKNTMKKHVASVVTQTENKQVAMKDVNLMFNNEPPKCVFRSYNEMPTQTVKLKPRNTLGITHKNISLMDDLTTEMSLFDNTSITGTQTYCKAASLPHYPYLCEVLRSGNNDAFQEQMLKNTNASCDSSTQTDQPELMNQGQVVYGTGCSLNNNKDGNSPIADIQQNNVGMSYKDSVVIYRDKNQCIKPLKILNQVNYLGIQIFVTQNEVDLDTRPVSTLITDDKNTNTDTTSLAKNADVTLEREQECKLTNSIGVMATPRKSVKILDDKEQHTQTFPFKLQKTISSILKPKSVYDFNCETSSSLEVTKRPLESNSPKFYKGMNKSLSNESLDPYRTEGAKMRPEIYKLLERCIENIVKKQIEICTNPESINTKNNRPVKCSEGKETTRNQSKIQKEGTSRNRINREFISTLKHKLLQNKTDQTKSYAEIKSNMNLATEGDNESINQKASSTIPEETSFVDDLEKSKLNDNMPGKLENELNITGNQDLLSIPDEICTVTNIISSKLNLEKETSQKETVKSENGKLKKLKQEGKPNQENELLKSIPDEICTVTNIISSKLNLENETSQRETVKSEGGKLKKLKQEGKPEQENELLKSMNDEICTVTNIISSKLNLENETSQRETVKSEGGKLKKLKQEGKPKQENELLASINDEISTVASIISEKIKNQKNSNEGKESHKHKIIKPIENPYFKKISYNKSRNNTEVIYINGKKWNKSQKSKVITLKATQANKSLQNVKSLTENSCKKSGVKFDHRLDLTIGLQADIAESTSGSNLSNNSSATNSTLVAFSRTNLFDNNKPEISFNQFSQTQSESSLSDNSVNYADDRKFVSCMIIPLQKTAVTLEKQKKTKSKDKYHNKSTDSTEESFKPVEICKRRATVEMETSMRETTKFWSGPKLNQLIESKHSTTVPANKIKFSETLMNTKEFYVPVMNQAANRNRNIYRDPICDTCSIPDKGKLLIHRGEVRCIKGNDNIRKNKEIPNDKTAVKYFKGLTDLMHDTEIYHKDEERDMVENTVKESNSTNNPTSDNEDNDPNFQTVSKHLPGELFNAITKSSVDNLKRNFHTCNMKSEVRSQAFKADDLCSGRRDLKTKLIDKASAGNGVAADTDSESDRSDINSSVEENIDTSQTEYENSVSTEDMVFKSIVNTTLVNDYVDFVDSVIDNKLKKDTEFLFSQFEREMDKFKRNVQIGFKSPVLCSAAIKKMESAMKSAILGTQAVKVAIEEFEDAVSVVCNTCSTNQDAAQTIAECPETLVGPESATNAALLQPATCSSSNGSMIEHASILLSNCSDIIFKTANRSIIESKEAVRETLSKYKSQHRVISSPSEVDSKENNPRQLEHSEEAGRTNDENGDTKPNFMQTENTLSDRNIYYVSTPAVQIPLEVYNDKDMLSYCKMEELDKIEEVARKLMEASTINLLKKQFSLNKGDIFGRKIFQDTFEENVPNLALDNPTEESVAELDIHQIVNTTNNFRSSLESNIAQLQTETKKCQSFLNYLCNYNKENRMAEDLQEAIGSLSLHVNGVMQITKKISLSNHKSFFQLIDGIINILDAFTSSISKTAKYLYRAKINASVTDVEINYHVSFVAINLVWNIMQNITSQIENLLTMSCIVKVTNERPQPYERGETLLENIFYEKQLLRSTLSNYLKCPFVKQEECSFKDEIIEESKSISEVTYSTSSKETLQYECVTIDSLTSSATEPDATVDAVSNSSAPEQSDIEINKTFHESCESGSDEELDHYLTKALYHSASDADTNSDEVSSNDSEDTMYIILKPKQKFLNLLKLSSKFASDNKVKCPLASDDNLKDNNIKLSKFSVLKDLLLKNTLKKTSSQQLQNNDVAMTDKKEHQARDRNLISSVEENLSNLNPNNYLVLNNNIKSSLKSNSYHILSQRELSKDNIVLQHKLSLHNIKDILDKTKMKKLNARTIGSNRELSIRDEMYNDSHGRCCKDSEILLSEKKETTSILLV